MLSLWCYINHLIRKEVLVSAVERHLMCQINTLTCNCKVSRYVDKSPAPVSVNICLKSRLRILFWCKLLAISGKLDGQNSPFFKWPQSANRSNIVLVHLVFGNAEVIILRACHLPVSFNITLPDYIHSIYLSHGSQGINSILRWGQDNFCYSEGVIFQTDFVQESE